MDRKELRQKAKKIAKKYGYLPYMIERYLSLWGEDETYQFLESCDKPIPTAIRVNQLRIPIKELISRLEKKDVQLKQIPWIEEGFWADFGGYSPGALFEHMLGYYYVQGVPSMTVSRVLDPKPNEVVIDLAAAPGGKSTHIAQLMENTGKLFAIDQDRLRLTSLESNILRCGVINSIVLRGDARKISELGLRPDKIMLDAPCSGEGLIPIDSSRKTSKSMADIRYCATRQEEMLEEAISVLAPGGVLVYATCSIAPEENEFVLDNILRKHHEIKLSKISLDFGTPGIVNPYGVDLDESLKLTKRFLPHRDGTEGFFVAKIIKEEGVK
ncbi:MAG: NOL1/NOP2/sun family putative RNA methylase [Candidatus Lokiarchaeota archaeon]|nr:NOL1/NOP2/sun family putative RNA methylase [Candidatus Lokiarchaeota archaeon]